jgi:hypothetical protein
MWFIAECQECTPVLPVPFTSEQQRDEWIVAHGIATGHGISKWTENAAHQRIG